MEDIKIFDAYQRSNILPSIGGSDDIYEKLTKAANSLTELMVKNPKKIIPFVLVALDCDITEEEPVLQEVEKVVSEHWLMVRSQFKSMPITLYRAVILQGLEDLIKKEDKYACIVWFAGIDVYPHLPLKAKEKEILLPFLQKVGDQAEVYATTEWSVDESESKFSLPAVKIELKKLEGKVNVKTLTAGIAAASGPTKKDGTKTNGNTRYPYTQTNYQSSQESKEWAWSFAPLAASAISQSLNTALSEIETGLKNNNTEVESSINSFTKNLKTKLTKTLTETKKSSVAVERRSQILWWKETLYSRKIHDTYRKLSKFETAIAMAFDLYLLLPSIFPVSVDYILKEAFYKVHGSQDNTIRIGDFLTEFEKNENADFLKKFFSKEDISDGRIDFSSFLQKVLFEKTNVEKILKNQVGITYDKEISYEDLSVWILHSLSAKHLTA